MVVVRFANGSEWFKANWVFRRLVKEVAEVSPNETELNFTLEQADALGGLFLDCLEPDRAEKVLNALKSAAAATKDRDRHVEGEPDDQAAQLMYAEAVDELLDCIRQQEGA